MGKQKSKIDTRSLVEHAINQSGTVVDALALIVPVVGIALYTARSFYGYAMVRKQNELNEYVEHIRDHPEIFTKNLTSSEAFQDGVVGHLEAYLKLRSEEKRFVARQILNDFALSDDKIDYPLERLQDTVSKISRQALGVLGFLQHTIQPRRLARIEAMTNGINLSTSDRDRDWWREEYQAREPISTDIELWIKENFSPNSEKVMNRLNNGQALNHYQLDEAFAMEKREREKIGVPVSELVQLGIMSVGAGPATWGGSEPQTRFTDFGLRFIKFIENPDFTELLTGARPSP